MGLSSASPISAGLFPYAEDLSRPTLSMCGSHGAEQLYTSGYTDPQLDWWAEAAERVARGQRAGGREEDHPANARERMARDVYVYFDNDAKVHAPFDAGA